MSLGLKLVDEVKMFGCLALLSGLLILRPASSAIRDGRNVYATAGETVSFPCALHQRTSRPITRPYGSWSWQPNSGQKATIVSYQYSGTPSKGLTPMRERSRMEADFSFGDFALNVMHVQKVDEGTFTCDFKNGQDAASGTFSLRLLEVTSSIGSPVLDNEEVSLALSLSLGSVQWTGPEGEERTGTTLVLRPPLKPGRQKWACKFSHAGGSLAAEYSFVVIGFTHHLPDTLYLKPHQAVTLPCLLSSLPPKLADSDDLGWFRDGSVFHRPNVSGLSGQGKGVDLSVRLRPEKVADSGAFECRLSLGNRIISSLVLVCVINVTSDHSGSIKEFDKTRMTCAVSTSCPVTRLMWVRGDGSRGNGSDTQVKGSVTRTLPRVDQTQAGLWLCLVYEKESLVENVTFWMNVTVLAKPLTVENLFVMLGMGAGCFLMLVFLLVLVICLVKRSQRRRRAVRRLRHPLCREHGNQLSNQPLCPGNDYIDTNRPLPPPPYRRCPHNPPRKGRSNRGNSRRSPSQPVYVT